MSDHSFNPFIAKNHGIVESILINSFIFWTKTNSAKEKNFHDGRYWCFGTPEFFSKYHPYLTPRQIKYALSKLIKSGALLKGEYNKKRYDKTNWYSLSDKILIELNLDKSCLNPATTLINIDCTKLPDGLDNFSLPIPDNKQDTKKNNISDSGESQKTKSKNINKDIQEIIDIWNEIAVPKGCPKQGNEKRSIQEITQNIKIIKEQWEHPFTADNFRKWLNLAIELKFYLLTKPGYMTSLKVILRWEHFYQAYNNYLNEINNDNRR